MKTFWISEDELLWYSNVLGISSAKQSLKALDTNYSNKKYSKFEFEKINHQKRFSDCVFQLQIIFPAGTETLSQKCYHLLKLNFHRLVWLNTTTFIKDWKNQTVPKNQRYSFPLVYNWKPFLPVRLYLGSPSNSVKNCKNT